MAFFLGDPMSVFGKIQQRKILLIHLFSTKNYF